MTTEIAKPDPQQQAMQRAESLSSVLIAGDLSRLTEDQKARYYLAVCEATGLNPMAQPFGFIKTQNGIVIYAKKSATEQLRKRDNVSVTLIRSQAIEGVYEVVAKATTPDGREDTDVGAVNIEGLKGEARANAIMKATTKAKRRVTLSICGLGMLDESETDSIPGAQVVATPKVQTPAVQTDGKPAEAPAKPTEAPREYQHPDAGESEFEEPPPPSDPDQARVERVMAALHSVKQQWTDPNCKARLSALIERQIPADGAISELSDDEAEKIVAYCTEYRAKLDARKKKDKPSTNGTPAANAAPAPAAAPAQTPAQQFPNSPTINPDQRPTQASRDVQNAILKECDRMGRTWPVTRNTFWAALGVAAASDISGVDSLSQQQGDLLLSILKVQPAAAGKAAA